MTSDEEQAHQNAILQVAACSIILHFAIDDTDQSSMVGHRKLIPAFGSQTAAHPNDDVEM